MWIGEFFSRISVYMTLEKEEENMQVEYTFIIAMENGWWILIYICSCFLFYLKYEKKRRVIHISLTYIK